MYSAATIHRHYRHSTDLVSAGKCGHVILATAEYMRDSPT